MPADESVAAFINGDSRAVEVEMIQNELDKLWQGAADNGLVARACRFNLLVYSPNEGAYERATAALAESTRRHPCRAIVLMVEPDAAENEVTAYLSAHWHASEEKRVGCEQIAIIAKGNAVDKLPESATALLVGDLPAVLWWQGDLPEESVLFEKLLASSRHLIFDSADGRDAGNTLSRARAVNLVWKTRNGEAGICGDLNWLRLSLYRNLVAQFLESSLVKPALHSVDEVTVEVIAATEGDAHFVQPFLLLGWLAGFLSWKLNEPLTAISENAFQTNWQNKANAVVGKIILHKAAAEIHEAIMPGDVIAARLQLRPNGETMIFSLQRDPSQPRMKLRIAKGEQALTESMEQLSDASTSELLALALAQNARDQVYESALRVATQLI